MRYGQRLESWTLPLYPGGQLRILSPRCGCLGEKRKRGIPALMGFKEAAQVTGLTKQRISQLRQSIEADGRFTIQSRGKKLLLRLLPVFLFL